MNGVVHCKRESYDVYIGRRTRGFEGSIWRNQFIIGEDGTREDVINKYRTWIKSRPDMLARLSELKGKILGCWCSPKPCHGDVLIELINEADE